MHPNQIRPEHIVRRSSTLEARLLANQLPFLKPGELLAAARGEVKWPHRVYELYWPKAQAHSFAPRENFQP